MKKENKQEDPSNDDVLAEIVTRGKNTQQVRGAVENAIADLEFANPTPQSFDRVFDRLIVWLAADSPYLQYVVGRFLGRKYAEQRRRMGMIPGQRNENKTE